MKLWVPASREERFVAIALSVVILGAGLAAALVLLWIGRANDVVLSVSLGCGIFAVVSIGGVVASVARDGRYEVRDNLISGVQVALVLVALSLTLIVLVRVAEVVEFYYKWREAGQ